MASLGRDEILHHGQRNRGGATHSGWLPLLEAAAHLAEKPADPAAFIGASSQATTTAGSQAAETTPAKHSAATAHDATESPVNHSASTGGNDRGSSAALPASPTRPSAWSTWSSPSRHPFTADGSSETDHPQHQRASDSPTRSTGPAQPDLKSHKLGRMLLLSSPQQFVRPDEDDDQAGGASTLTSSPLRSGYDWMRTSMTLDPTMGLNGDDGQLPPPAAFKSLSQTTLMSWAHRDDANPHDDASTRLAGRNWIAEYSANPESTLPGVTKLPYRRTQAERSHETGDARNMRRRFRRYARKREGDTSGIVVDLILDGATLPSRTGAPPATDVPSMGPDVMSASASAVLAELMAPAADIAAAEATAAVDAAKSASSSRNGRGDNRVFANPRFWNQDAATDMYTPRAIRGTNMDREGLCTICVKPNWLRTRKSVYWSHMQFVHGIDSQTRQPYPEPTLYGLPKTVHDSHGFCDRCRQWVRLSKRPNVTTPTPEWFRHSYECRRRFTIADKNMATIDLVDSTVN